MQCCSCQTRARPTSRRIERRFSSPVRALAGWLDAKVAFIMSGGYKGIAERIRDVQQPTLVLWGKQDGILDSKYALQFQVDLPRAKVVVFEKCGHVPHLEQSERCCAAILDFCAADLPVQELVGSS